MQKQYKGATNVSETYYEGACAARVQARGFKRVAIGRRSTYNAYKSNTKRIREGV